MTSPTIAAGTSGQQSVSGANGTTFAPTLPVGTVAGDLLVAIFYTDAAGTVTMPTGFTNLYNVNPSGAMHLRVDWKIAVGSDATSWSWTGSVWRVGALLRITGAQSSGTPYERNNSASNTTSVASTNSSLPSVAATGAATIDDLAIMATAITNDNAPTWSAPSTWTLQWNSSDDVGIVKQTLASGAAAPASTHVTISDSNAVAGPGASVVLFIKSPAAGGTTFNLSGSTTQAQSLTVINQVRLPRSVTQAQALSMVRAVALVRSVSQAQTLSLRRAVSLSRSLAQAQALSVRQAVQRTLALTQAQSLSIVAQRVFLRTVTATQAQSVALTTSVRRTYTLTVSAIQAQVLSLIAVVSGQPPPVPVAVPSRAPLPGTAVSNYLDWPVLIVTSSGVPPSGQATPSVLGSPSLRITSTTIPPPNGEATGGT
jgi:hypothetical protein